jgi:hypothetical protein
MIKSTMIILLVWFQTLVKLKLDAPKMPRDILTRWNSMFDMLVFTLAYKTAVDDITGNKVANLWQYE